MEGGINSSDGKQNELGVNYGPSSSQKGTSSNISSSQSSDGQRDHKHGKKFERSRHRDFFRNRPYHSKSGETFGEETRESFREDTPQQPIQESTAQSQTQPTAPQQPAAPVYPPYGFNPPDPAYVDGSRRALTMMSPYNLYAAMNPQWGMNPSDMSVNSATSGLPVASGMEMGQSSATGMNPYPFMGMPPESNMYSMMGMGNYCQYGMTSQGTGIMKAAKEVITLTKSVLYPPNPNAAPPTLREKPPGCKTIFVGGLPEKASEEIIKEVFERFGEILTIRMSIKNFCHIRFSEESHVENAIYLSGYRIKIENKDDGAYSNRLHVDYAHTRDDQYEHECRQRKAQREARRKEQLEQEAFRPPTPPPVVQYSDHETTLLGEKLRAEETFQETIFTLVTWLERGECNKRRAGFFYSMIQSTNSHIRRLMNEKLKYEEELNRAKMRLKQQMQGILMQFNEISKVFAAASLQKVWDHFTKAQRKNIEMWKKQTEEIRNAHVEEVLNDRIEDEMELSDDDDSSVKMQEENNYKDQKDLLQELKKYKEECEALRCQLEASENEVLILRSESEAKNESDEQQIQYLRQALQGFQKEILTLNQKQAKDEAEIKELLAFKAKHGEESREKANENDLSSCDHQREVLSFAASVSSSVSLNITENEARLIGLISTFLNVHPFGASIEYICSYLHQIDSTITSRDVESLMKRFPSVFNEASTGIGASLEKKWTFSGFK